MKDTRLERQQAMDFALSGEHLFGSSLLDWNISYAKATEDRPDERYVAYDARDIAFTSNYSDMRQPILNAVNPADMEIDNGNYGLDELAESHQDVDEDDFKARVNFNIPVVIGAQTGAVKIGAKMVLKDKSYRTTFYEYEPINEAAFNNDMMSHLVDPVRKDYMAGDYKVDKFISEKTLGALDLNNSSEFNRELNPEEMGDNFDTNEDVYSAFVRFDQKLSNKVSMTAGLRAEATYLTTRGVILDTENPMQGWEDGNIPWSEEVKSDYLNVLPSLFRYDINNNLLLRASYKDFGSSRL